MRRLGAAVIVVTLLGCGDDEAGARVDGGLDASGSTPLDAAHESADASGVTADGALAPLADTSVPSTPDTGVCSFAEQLLPVTQPAYHRQGKIAYADPPPVGGDHNPCWGEWRVYDEAQPLEVEHWVHNLEHGGVIYLYRCPDGCPDELAALSKFVEGRTQALLTPYDQLPTRFAVVSWGVRITSDCFDASAFEGFYERHVNMGTEQITSDPPDSCL